MPIEVLCDNILETRFDNFDATTVKNAKLRILDVPGCAIGGAGGSGNPGPVDLVRSWGGSGPGYCREEQDGTCGH